MCLFQTRNVSRYIRKIFYSLCLDRQSLENPGSVPSGSMSEDQNEVRPLLSAAKNDVEDALLGGSEIPQIDDGRCTALVDTEMLYNVMRLAVPAALTYLLRIAHGIIAVAMFAHTNSDDLATVAMFISVNNFTGHAVVAGLCSGFDTLAPRAFGARDHLQVGILVKRTLAVVLCCGCTTQCVLSVFMCPILKEIGVDTAVASRVGEMMRWYCLASPLAHCSNSHILVPLLLNADWC